MLRFYLNGKTEMNYWYRFERYDGTVSPVVSMSLTEFALI